MTNAIYKFQSQVGAIPVFSCKCYLRVEPCSSDKSNTVNAVQDEFTHFAYLGYTSHYIFNHHFRDIKLINEIEFFTRSHIPGAIQHKVNCLNVFVPRTSNSHEMPQVIANVWNASKGVKLNISKDSLKYYAKDLHQST